MNRFKFWGLYMSWSLWEVSFLDWIPPLQTACLGWLHFIGNLGWLECLNNLYFFKECLHIPWCSLHEQYFKKKDDVFLQCDSRTLTWSYHLLNKKADELLLTMREELYWKLFLQNMEFHSAHCNSFSLNRGQKNYRHFKEEKILLYTAEIIHINALKIFTVLIIHSSWQKMIAQELKY